jgi:hypothetical protein
MINSAHCAVCTALNKSTAATASRRRNKGIAPYGLPLLLPQPQARRVAIGELDAGLFQHALDRREIVLHRGAPALLEQSLKMFREMRAAHYQVWDFASRRSCSA